MEDCCRVDSCGHKEHAQIPDPGVVLSKGDRIAQQPTAEWKNHHDATTIELVRKVGDQGEGDRASGIQRHTEIVGLETSVPELTLLASVMGRRCFGRINIDHVFAT